MLLVMSNREYYKEEDAKNDKNDGKLGRFVVSFAFRSNEQATTLRRKL